MSKFDLEEYRKYVRENAETVALSFIVCAKNPQSGVEAYLEHMRENYQHVNVATDIFGNTIEGEYQVINEPKQLENKHD